MQKESKERLPKEPVVIGILGPIGSGKSTLSRILSNDLQIKRVEENFPMNPYLEKFYEDRYQFSFLSQVWFLKSTVDQLMDLKSNESVILDPTNEMNYLYAKTHLDMGWMTQREFNLYGELYSILEDKSGIKKPDLYLSVNTRMDVLTKRIRKRGEERPYEILMLDNYPEYLSKLSDNVNAFMGGRVLHIDTSHDSFTDKKNIDNLVNKIKKSLK